MKTVLRFSKVLLINPPGAEQSGYTPPPLGILYLASYLRSIHPTIKVDIVDGAIKGESEVLKRISSSQPDLVGLSVMTPNRLIAVRLSQKIKKICPCQIVFGGVHPTLMWQQMLTKYKVIDYIVKGEGEITLAELVSNKPFGSIRGLVWKKNNQIIDNPDRPLIGNLDNLPFPAWDLVNPFDYPPRGTGITNGINLEQTPRIPIIFSRGCMGSCSFCSTWKIWRGYRSRSGNNVFKEIKILHDKYHLRHFAFQDDTLTGNHQEIINFCRQIIQSKLKVALFGCTRVDFVDLELLKTMKAAGFYEISYGIESGSPSILRSINKKTNIATALKAATLTKKAGLKICILMMYGLPAETPHDRQLSQKLVEKINPDEIGSLGQTWILPGTAIYHQAKKSRLLTDNFWLTPQPYYVYRGGIGNDPVDRKTLFKDWYQWNSQTFLGILISLTVNFKSRLNILMFKLRSLISPL